MATTISPLAFVDPSAKLGDNVKIHPFAFVDKDVEIGDGCTVYPYASIIRGTRMGRNNRVFQGAVVGAEPQDFRWRGDITYCHIGDNNVIREQVIINRGIAHEGGTSIGDDCYILAKSHIGHDSHLVGRIILGNGVTMAGNVTVDSCTILSSNVIVHEGSHIGKWVLVKGGCRIAGNVPPYVIIAHNPAAYFGINAYVLQRKGFAEGVINDIAKAYRNIYQSGISVYNALQRVEADVAPGPERSEIVDFIRANDLSIVAIPRDMLVD